MWAEITAAIEEACLVTKACVTTGRDWSTVRVEMTDTEVRPHCMKILQRLAPVLKGLLLRGEIARVHVPRNWQTGDFEIVFLSVGIEVRPDDNSLMGSCGYFA